MKTVKLYLTCPNCGNSTWLPTEGGSYECLACGDTVDIEDMPASAEELQGKEKTA